LNRAAGDRARGSTAYQAALDHFRTSVGLLGDAGWSRDYALTFAVHLAEAEGACLCGRFDGARGGFDRLLARARTALDKARVYELRVVQHENLSRYAEAVRIGSEGCGLFGMAFPGDPAGRATALEDEMRAIERLRADRPIASLV